MPFMTNGKRDYKKQRERYDGKPAQKKKRAARNAARSKLEKEGKGGKGDGKHVDHKRPLSKGGSNKRSNLRVTTAKKNLSHSINKRKKK